MNTRILLFVLIFIFVSNINKAFAATVTYTWTGASGDGKWTTTGNWSSSTNKYPGNATTDIASFPASTVNVTVPSGNTIKFASITLSNGGTITITNSSGNTMTISGGFSKAAGGTTTNLTLTGASPYSISGTAAVGQAMTFTTNGTVGFTSGSIISLASTSAVMVNSGTLNPATTTFTLSGTSASLTNSAGATVNATGCTFNLSGSASSITNKGTFNATSTCSFALSQTNTNVTNTGTNAYFRMISGTIKLTGSNADFDNSTTMTLYQVTMTGTQTGNNINNSVAAASMTSDQSSFTFSGATSGINNAGTYLDHRSTFNIGNNGTISSLSIQNTGTMTLKGSTVELYANNATLENDNIFTADSSSSISLKSQKAQVLNTATFNDHGSTYTLGSTSTNINNSGTYIFDTNAAINITGTNSFVYNSQTLTAGTSGSACTITASANGIKLASVSSTAYTTIYNDGGIFTLGSTSSINLNGTSTTTPEICYNNGGTFTLMSDPNGSATVGQLGTGGSMQGSYNVQRYISATRGYRALAAPVNQTSYTTAPGNADLTDLWQSETVPATVYGAYVAGPTGGGFPNTNTAGNPIIYLYQENLQPTSYNATFLSGNNVGVSAISGSGNSFSFTTTNSVTGGANGNQDNVSGVTLPAGNGFLLYYIGNSQTSAQRSAPVTTSTITHTGYINQGDITFKFWGKTTSSSALSITSSSRYPGLTLLGNPYPSAIDLYELYLDNEVTYAVHGSDIYFNTSLSGVFYSLNGLNNSNFPSVSESIFGNSGAASAEYIASGEGFYAVVGSLLYQDFNGNTYPTPTDIVFSEDQKVTTSTSSTGAVYLAATKPKAVAARPQYANLHLKLTGNTTTDIDECGIYLDKTFNDKLDSRDAKDLDGVAPSLYLSSFTSDNVRTAINALGDYTNGKRIKLYVKGTTDGIFKLALEDINNIDTTNFKVYLLDTKLNDSLDMVHYKSYAFNLSAADTSDFAGRFLLAFEPKPVPPYQLITFAGEKAPSSGIKLDWKTENEGNYTSFGLEKLGTNGLYSSIDSVQSTGAGVYTFNDQSPIMGNNIYRLAQSDIHGKITFAGPININYNTIAVNGMFTIYPNPSKDIINISVNSGVTGSQNTPVYQATIYDLAGAVMDSRQVNTNNWTQDVTSYKAGVYILELKTTSGNIVGKAKFVKTN